MLAGLIAGCAVFAGPLSRYTEATAQQLFANQAYRQSVLGTLPMPPAYDVRREMRERQTKP
jgi:multicomponent K+:H+ antiporter subunit D